MERNVFGHKQAGYAAVTLSLKKTGVAPGDATDVQLDAVADLSDAYSLGEIRVSHEQNLILLRETGRFVHRLGKKPKRSVLPRRILVC